MARLAGDHFVARQPHRALDSFVQWVAGAFAQRLGNKGDAQEAVVEVRGVVVIDAQHRGGLDVPAGLLQRLADRAGDQGLPLLPVSGRLVLHRGAVDLLLDDQEAAIALDDAGDHDMRRPGHQGAPAGCSEPLRRSW